MFSHLFFDLDHTLWDFEKNSVLALAQTFDQHKLKENGLDFNAFEKVYHAHNDRMWDRFRKGFINRETLRWKRFWLALLDFKIADEPLAYKMSDTYLELLPIQTALIPDTVEVLEFCLSKNYQLHIMTNGFEKTQIQKMENSGIKNYFTQIITSEAAMALKPKKEIYLYAQQMTGATEQNALMIGDTPEADILGANTAHWQSVHFNPNGLPTEIKPTHEIRLLKELISILN